jgi:hypothetical protein
MRIPDSLLNAVCFLGIEFPDGTKTWGGTAFLVAIPWEAMPEWSSTYVVTARHNLQRAQRTIEERGGTLCLRMNGLQPDEVVVVRIGDDIKWLVPADLGSDVAVLNWTPPTDRVEYTRISRSMVVTAAFADRERIGLGDELAIVGLFAKRAGSDRNLPIVRSGVIAAAPSEPLVNGLTGAPMEGCYLAELRSIGGLSGSPVFVILSYGRTLWGDSPSIRHESTLALLGLIHGHWDISKKEFLAIDWDDDEPLNTGIAVIVPMTDALSLIDQESEVAKRQALAAAERLGTGSAAQRVTLPDT